MIDASCAMALEESMPQEQQEVPQQITLSKAILRIQSALLDLPRCTEYQLVATGAVLSRPDYEDVITERCIAGLCGYPRCPNQLPSDRPRRGRYRISLREHRVYDLQESYSFCSEECLIGSRAFSGTLAAERCSDLSQSRILQVLALFDGENGDHENVLDVREKKKGGSLDDDDFGLSKLTILEKSEVNTGGMLLQDWAGPTNAIEGYVPQRDRENGSVHKIKPKPQTPKVSPKGNKGIVDFTSEIICDYNLHPFHAMDLSSLSHSKFATKSIISTCDDFATKVDLMSTNSTVMGEPSHVSADPEKSSSSLPRFTDSQWINSEGGESPGSHEQVKGQILKSSLKLPGSKNHNHAVKWADKDKRNNSLANDEDGQGCHGQVKGQQLKSSLKFSGKKSQRRNVKWADKCEGNHSLSMDVDFQGKPHSRESIDINRFSSAKGSAYVPVMASEVVESKVADAVIDAEATLPPHMTKETLGSLSDTYQEDPTYQRDLLKWPKKSVLLESDTFDVTDSWHDDPPEGFSLTLSPFATMWMALFGWISSSSIAYIYGQNQESWEEFSFVNGREYARKMSSSDGRSLEIRLTLAGCLERCLPQVILDLRLPTPVSIIEKAMWQLLETMSFIDAIPPFKTREWHVIAVLFMDALSVSRVPALTRHMVDNRALLQKVLDAAQIGNDEYETMKDLLIPLEKSQRLSEESWA